jgi:outer membrane protein OmpA-like peptidoglycan-associated protein
MTAAHLDRLAASDPDPDGDGIHRSVDRCPDAAEDFDGFEDEDGCPDPDNDHDGIPDAADRCPLQPETVNGIDDDDGCPDRGLAQVAVQGGKLTIKEKIHFATGSDVLDPASSKLLQQVAAFLRAQWTIRRVRIEGHTDDRGDKEMNVDLSERRARRVMTVLAGHGVAAHRLDAKGYGPTVPVGTNQTVEGRGANRRVEFTIVTAVKPGGGQ